MRAILQDLTPPVDLDRDHWRGGERAVVTLVEYGDYECPYSRMAFRTIQRLEQQFAGQLRFVFRQLPLTGIHPHALAAVHFAEAAALQGRFWPRPPCTWAQIVGKPLLAATAASRGRSRSTTGCRWPASTATSTSCWSGSAWTSPSARTPTGCP